MFSLCLNFVIRIFARMRAVSVIDFSFATTMHILLPLNADFFFILKVFQANSAELQRELPQNMK